MIALADKPKVAMKGTKLIQRLEPKNGQVQTSEVLFPMSKSRTIDKMKKSLPFPHKFFYDLGRNSIATFTDEWGNSVTLQLIELEPN